MMNTSKQEEEWTKDGKTKITPKFPQEQKMDLSEGRVGFASMQFVRSSANDTDDVPLYFSQRPLRH